MKTRLDFIVQSIIAIMFSIHFEIHFARKIIGDCTCYAYARDA